jgi:hypothetical protein
MEEQNKKREPLPTSAYVIVLVGLGLLLLSQKLTDR